jgi:hypothetical protein
MKLRGETHLENLLQNNLQTAQRRTQDFSVCNICLACLGVHALWVHADKIYAFAGEIVLRDERELVLPVWLVLWWLF